MHPLNNSSQVTEAPAPKPRIGSPGYFSESNENGAPSYPGADWFNANIKEFMNVLNGAQIEFEPDRFDHFIRAIAASGKAAVLESFVGLRLKDSFAGVNRTAIALRGDGSEVLRADFPKLLQFAVDNDQLVDQALIDANPEQYAANYGTGDGTTTFTLPNYGLMPWDAAAGVYGDAGTTAEDQLQNITGSYTTRRYANPSGDEVTEIFTKTGALDSEIISTPETNTVLVGSNNDTALQQLRISIDASKSARTGAYTRPKTNFSDVWIIHGEIA